MSKALVIAEKPSVAADIAKALGGFTKKEDVYEREDMVVASAVGHLLELTLPEEYDVKRGKWTFAQLPVIPPYFALQPIASSASKLKTIQQQIKRKDVDIIVNACDAGREGELIFRYIVQHAKAKQPVKRLWLQSMTPASIREAFSQLRTDSQMLPLADAARCRSEADWLVGINGTRAMTAFNNKEGGFFLTPVGRVQTPTLALVVEREHKIRRFVARDFFEVRGRFDAEAGQYDGRWFDPKFKKQESDPEAKPERIWDKAMADAIVARCKGQKATVTEESKSTTSSAPALFDLTSLQREANGRFGMSAKSTLGIAQSLYERHKVLTYPRTDSKALPEDYIATVRTTIDSLGNLASYRGFSEQIGRQGWVRPNKRIFDNAKVSDHFAIIPTGEIPKNLSEPEQKIYDLVVRRFLAIFYPSAEFLVTTRISTVGQDTFKTEGKILVQPGWLAVYGKESEGADDSLVAVRPGETPLVSEVRALGLTTKPPARYSEATLLGAMESAGKLVDDDELREAMAGKGLGTPATRAAIIEGLLGEKYLLREGRELMPTAKAMQLITLLKGLGVQELTLPELTGEWEHKLSLIESGKLSREAFMHEIATMTERMVGQAKNFTEETVPGDYATLQTPCPMCSGTVRENYRRFACTSCDFSISKTPGGRTLAAHEAEELLTRREIGPLDDFRSAKTGRPFVAIMRIGEDGRLAFDFGQGDEDSSTPVDFSQQEPLASCPLCHSGVYQHGVNYVCEKAVGPEKTCTFQTGIVILQQPVPPEQLQKLVATGRTDLLENFVSARTRRKFKAFLVLDPSGKVGFEFEQRPERADGAARKPARTAAKTAKTAKTTKTTKGGKAAAAKTTTRTAASAKKPASPEGTAEAEKPKRRTTTRKTSPGQAAT